jgi:serine/threonine protein kinase
MVRAPYWRSPEATRRAKVGSSTDIWSLGVLLIEMIDGISPYADMEPLKAIYLIATSSAPPIKFPFDKLSPAFIVLLEKCIQREPEKRETASALLLVRSLVYATETDADRYDSYL